MGAIDADDPKVDGCGGVGGSEQTGGPSQTAHGGVGVGRCSEGSKKELSDLLADGS